MLPLAFLLILAFRPSYGLLGWFTVTMGILVIGLPLVYADYSDPQTWSRLGAFFASKSINVLVFAAIGAIIVFVLGGKRQNRRDKELDQEMSRIRAEIAEREKQSTTVG